MVIILLRITFCFCDFALSLFPSDTNLKTNMKFSAIFTTSLITLVAADQLRGNEEQRDLQTDEAPCFNSYMFNEDVSTTTNTEQQHIIMIAFLVILTIAYSETLIGRRLHLRSRH